MFTGYFFHKRALEVEQQTREIQQHTREIQRQTREIQLKLRGKPAQPRRTHHQKTGR